jgi:hypothetical protein
VTTTLNVGDKVKFRAEAQRYTVRAAGDRFAVCTKPFNARRTVIYTIIDFAKGIRGPENLVFPFGAETDEQCREMLARLDAGQSAVSHRRHLPLDIE